VTNQLAACVACTPVGVTIHRTAPGNTGLHRTTPDPHRTAPGPYRAGND